MAARPAYRVYEFCSNVANRVLPSGFLTDGFAGGDPIGEGWHNYLFGVTTQWLVWLQSSALSYVGGNIVVIQPTAITWTNSAGASGTNYSTGGPPSTQRVFLASGGAYEAESMVSVAQGGAVNAVQIDVASAGNPPVNTYNVYVRIYDSTHTPTIPKYQHWEVLASAATGVVALAFNAGSSPGFAASTDPILGPVCIHTEVQLTAGVGTKVAFEGQRVQFATLTPATP